MLKAALLLLLVAAAYGCDMECLWTCASWCERTCTSSVKDCTGFTLQAEVDKTKGWNRWQCLMVNGSDPTKQMVNWGPTYAYYREKDGTWKSYVEKAWNLREVHEVGSRPWCPNQPNLTHCTQKDWDRPRHSQLWIPGLNHNADYIMGRMGQYNTSWDSVSSTWAYWNSEYNAKCKDSVNGLCGRAYPPVVKPVVEFAVANLSWAQRPILQVCCVCVLNGTYDWNEPMNALVEDAKKYGFSGYALDMECGGYNGSGRAAFLTDFGNRMKAVNDTWTIDWFTHGKWAPDVSFPNDAESCITMDTYGYPADSLIAAWEKLYQCQTGVALMYPARILSGDLFKFMAKLQGQKLLGSWGIVDNPHWAWGFALFLGKANASDIPPGPWPTNYTLPEMSEQDWADYRDYDKYYGLK